MKAVVMARGMGRRMRTGPSSSTLTDEQAAAAAAGFKAMMPMGGASGEAGRPFLDYVLHELAEAGVADVALVVGPEHDHVRRWYAGSRRPARLSVDFVVQPEPLGTADAVLAAEAWVDGASFLVINGDNLYPAAALRSLIALGAPGLAAFSRRELIDSGNIPADRIRAFATVDVDAESNLLSIVEKPPAGAIPDDDGDQLVSMNCWRFDSRIFAYCRDVPRSPRGEFELPAAVMRAAGGGLTFRVVVAAGAVLDLSTRGDVAGLSRRLSERMIRL